MSDFVRLLTFTTILAFACAGLTSCASDGNPAEEDPDSFEAVKDIHGGPFSDMTLVYLKTGPRTDLTEQQKTAVFNGHMSNMKRLADAGILLIAGPFNKPRDASWRGIFLLDTSSVALAHLQAETDPGIRAGVFVADYRPIKASILLRHTGDVEKAMQAERAEKPAEGRPQIRPYVMVTAADAATLMPSLAEAGYGDKVVWAAKFSAKGDRDAVAVIDAEKVEEVQAALDKAGVTGLSLDGWYATPSLLRLEPSVRTIPQK
ncbi:MAG TPA: hypothetical protein VEB22_00650 [Phycisphaerales bacterium]|nr:hypothetical protein [Phycisphaerales bacterium]